MEGSATAEDWSHRRSEPGMAGLIRGVGVVNGHHREEGQMATSGRFQAPYEETRPWPALLAMTKELRLAQRWTTADGE